MKHSLLTLITLAAATAAHADGFVCQSQEGLRIKAYNHTSPEAGTRVAAILVLSDDNVAAGNKTIATFSDSQQTLTSRGASYSADVDLRFATSSRKGELIAGTKLGQLQSIELNVDFSYAAPVEAGEVLPGSLVLTKRNGQAIEVEVSCERYLKN